jgi:hypothetical protein
MLCITQRIDLSRKGVGAAMGALSAIALMSLGTIAYCDDPVTMAPPIVADSTQTTTSATPNASANTVFNWSEVPQNQNVPINRAVFDQGGYQLYDNAGETLVVPFANNNLYVMKFAVSGDGTTYFVNTGSYPVLYLPKDGYLENASVAGAKWYPFTNGFNPTTPVFLGCAPSWPVFVDMGWYPDMVYYGGYWCDGPVFRVDTVVPCAGLFFQIGGVHYVGWHSYDRYCAVHPAPYTVTVVDTNIYNWARPVYAVNRSFGGVNTVWTNQPARFTRVFNGTGRPYAIPGAGVAPRPQPYQTTPRWSSTAGQSDNHWNTGSVAPTHVFQGVDRQTPASTQPSRSWQRPEDHGSYSSPAPQSERRPEAPTNHSSGRSADAPPSSNSGHSFQGSSPQGAGMRRPGF